MPILVFIPQQAMKTASISCVHMIFPKVPLVNSSLRHTRIHAQLALVARMPCGTLYGSMTLNARIRGDSSLGDEGFRGRSFSVILHLWAICSSFEDVWKVILIYSRMWKWRERGRDSALFTIFCKRFNLLLLSMGVFLTSFCKGNSQWVRAYS